jgi:xylulokinase
VAVLGIDVGTQSLKAVIVDIDMRVRGRGAVNYQPSFPHPGWAEQDPALWLAALEPAIGAALRSSGLRAGDLRSIGITGQLDGCVATSANGDALGPCLIWMDRRAEEEAKRIAPGLLLSRTGLVRDPSHMGAKIVWVRRNSPAAAQAAIWHQPVSFVVAALCGRAVMDHALASTTMLYGLAERGYADDLLAAFEIKRAMLPEIDDAAAVAGRLARRGAELTRLGEGLPVAVGTGDDFTNAIGAGVTRPGIVICNLGTGEAVGAVSRRCVIDRQALVETHSYLDGLFFVSNPGWLSGGAVAWFLSTFGVDRPDSLSALAETAAAGAAGLLFLPALTGAMAPRWAAGARGAFYGLTPAHGRAECARALLEGCAFALRDVVERFDALGVPASRIRLTGRAANNQLFAQIRADVTERPVEYGSGENAAPLGAAALASVAAGWFKDVPQAAEALPRDYRTLEPNPSVKAIYADAHGRYRQLFDLLSPIFDEGASTEEDGRS